MKIPTDQETPELLRQVHEAIVKAGRMPYLPVGPVRERKVCERMARMYMELKLDGLIR